MAPWCCLIDGGITCRCSRVLTSVHELIRAIERGEVARVPQLTGQVWECSSSRVSKSNCVASKRSMLQVGRRVLCVALL